MYTEKEVVRIAKRENNNKRKYLVVNQLQGKHIPVSPQKAFAMFEELSNSIKQEYQEEKVLLVGFAETATAIGAALAINLNSYYIQTTREEIKGVEYLYFSEQHSHATEQKLVKTDLDSIMNDIDRIIFVEDEITTGNTILNIVEVIQGAYRKQVRFSVASLLNGMDTASKIEFDNRKIRTHYLMKTNHGSYTSIAETYHDDGTYLICDPSHTIAPIKEIEAKYYLNARRLLVGEKYFKACEELWSQIESNSDFMGINNVLVLGTEEFMFPALYVAKRIEDKNISVQCHSTTRSPITVSSEAEYPLHTRYQLRSLYEDERVTYIYDLKKYDEVMIVTDSKSDRKAGLNTLVHALHLNGNMKIDLVRWC